MQDRNILTEAEAWVRRLFEKHHDPKLLYHNLHHTESVVHRAKEMGHHYQLTQDDLTVLIIAAWFHDTGHLFGENKEHEERSVEQYIIFTTGRNVSEIINQKIIGCIRSTKIPHNPSNFLEEVICDADTYDLGTSAFPQNDISLENEVRLRTGVSDKEWDSKTLELFQSHVFYTEYCKERLSACKEANYSAVLKRIK